MRSLPWYLLRNYNYYLNDEVRKTANEITIEALKKELQADLAGVKAVAPRD